MFPGNLRDGFDFFFQGQLVTQDVKGVIISGSSLALQKLRKSHSGTYKCSAENLEGSVVSNQVELNIKCKHK